MLPTIGTATERLRIDFKRELDLQTIAGKLEFAKDVAAFANSVGGTLFVGALEQNERLVDYPGVVGPDLEFYLRLGPIVVRDRLHPAPAVDFEPAEARDRTGRTVQILVVRVSPLPGQAVGVRVPQSVEANGSGQDAFRFPVRVSTQTKYYLPEQLPMLMDVAYRRKVQALQSIPEEERARIVVQGRTQDWNAKLIEIDETRNYFRVEVVNFPRNGDGQALHPPERRIPIDRVASVYQSAPLWWTILLDGNITPGGLELSTGR